MTAEHTQDEQFNSDHILAVLNRASEPYFELAVHAGQLGLHHYESQLTTDAEKAGNAAGATYLNQVGKGLIEDQHLAYELAVTQDHYESAKVQIVALSMEDSIKTTTLEQLAEQLKTAHQEQLNQYTLLGRRFINLCTTEKLPAADTKLEAYTDEELEERYDTTPINREDFGLTGYSQQVGGRAWNALTHRSERIRVGDDEGEKPAAGPQIHFLTLREKTSTYTYIADRYQDLSFTSFYNMVRWIDEQVTNEKVKVSALMGNNTGKQTLSACKQLIAIRAKQPQAE